MRSLCLSALSSKYLPSAVHPLTLSAMNATDMSEDTTLYDVAIIGAGPAGLAVAARLCEQVCHSRTSA